MSWSLRILVLLLTLALAASEACAQCWYKVSEDPPTYVEGPCDLWIGVYQTVPQTFAPIAMDPSAPVGTIETLGATYGAPVVAEDRYIPELAVWRCSSAPGSTVGILEFAMYGGEGSGAIPGGAAETLSFTVKSVGGKLTLLPAFVGQFGGEWCLSPASHTTTIPIDVAGGGAAVSRYGSWSGCGPMSTSSLKGPPGTCWQVSEIRQYTYSGVGTGFGSGPGGAVWRGELRFGSYIHVLHGLGSSYTPVYRPPSCAGVVPPSSPGVADVPSDLVCELRMYTGKSPLEVSALFDPGTFPEDPTEIPIPGTSSWFGEELGRDPADKLSPESEGSIGWGPFEVGPDVIPEWLPEGDAVPSDWLITIPLSEWTPMSNQTVRVPFAVWNGIRVVFRQVMIILCWLSCIRSLWNELGGRSDGDDA